MSILVGALRAELSGASASFEAAMAKSAASVDRTTKQMERTGRRLDSIGKGIQGVGMALSLTLSVPLTAMGVHAARTFGDFEAGMNRVRAVSGATGEDFARLESQAKDLGRTTAFTATQAAEGMGFLAMAGFQTNEIIGAMPGVLQLAAAAQMDLGRSADIVSNVLSGYGLEVAETGRATDVLTKAFTSANTDLEQLGQAFKFAGPVANSAGVQFEQTAAALALMGNAGIQSTMAGTSLRGAIVRLLNPTKAVQAELDRLRVTAVDASGRLLPLDQIIEQLRPHVEDTGAMMAIFGQRAGPAMANLVEIGADAIRDLTHDLERSAGVTAAIAETQMQGLKGSMIELGSAAEGLSIEVGSLLAPAVQSAAGVLTGAARVAAEEVVPAFRSLPGAAQVAAGGLLALAAAAGPVAFGTGLVLSGIGQTVVALGRLGILTRVATSWNVLRAAMFAAGNTTLVLSGHLAFLQGQTALSALGAKALAAATGLLTAAKGVLGGMLSAVTVRLGLGTAATMVQTAATGTLTLATGALTLAAKGLGLVLGFLGPAVLAAGAAFGGWKVGRWIGEVTGLEDALTGLIARMMGASEEAIAFEREHTRAMRAGEKAGGAIDEEAEALARLKDQLSDAGTSVDRLDKAMEELAAAGELDTVTMKRIGEQAKFLKDEGVELTDGLSNIVDWFERLHKESDPAAAAFDKLGEKTKTFAQRVEEARKQLRDSKIDEEVRRIARILEEGVKFEGPSGRDVAKDLGEGLDTGIGLDSITGSLDLSGGIVGGIPTIQQEVLGLAGAIGTLREETAHQQRLAAGLRAMGFSEEEIRKVVTGLDDGATATRDWAKDLQEFGAMFSIFGAGAGGLGATLGGGISAFKSGLDKIDLDDPEAGGFFGSNILSNLTGSFQLAGAALGVGKAIASLFGSNPVEKAAKQVGQRLGVEISEQLAEQIAKDTERLGDEVAANLVNLGSIFEEAGGVEAFGVDRAISSTRDLFSAVETGKLTVKEAGEAFDEAFAQIAPAAIDKTTGLASAGFRELIELSQRFGIESEEAARFVDGQLEQIVGGLKAFTDNATVTTQAGAQGLAGAVVSAFEQLRAQGVPTRDAIQQLSPVIEKLRADFTAAGLDGGAAFAALEATFAAITDEISGPAITAVNGLGDTLVGLANVGALNQETFGGLTAQIGQTFMELQAQGKAGPEVIGAMQPALQRVWALQRDFGFEVDDATKGLLDEAQAAGLVGDHMRDSQERAAVAMERVADTLDKLAQSMGVDLPHAAQQGARGIESAFGNMRLPPVNVDLRSTGGVSIPEGIDLSGHSFAGGGARTFDRRGEPAMLHGAEVIAPADRPSAVVDQLAQRIGDAIGRRAGKGDPGQTTHVHVSVDGRELFNLMFEGSQAGRLRIHEAALVKGS